MSLPIPIFIDGEERWLTFEQIVQLFPEDASIKDGVLYICGTFTDINREEG